MCGCKRIGEATTHFPVKLLLALDRRISRIVRLIVEFHKKPVIQMLEAVILHSGA